MRVLMISHSCQSAIEGQPKARQLARIPGVELCVLVPNRWKHYGKWRKTDQPPADCGYQFCEERITWPWLGPAKFYLHFYPRLAKVISDFKPDIIDLWEEPWSLVSFNACRLRNRICPDALILSETEQNIEKNLPFPFEKFRSYSLEQADWAIGRSTEAVQVLRNKGYTGPADVIPNAVDTGLFRPLDRDRCRADLGLSGFVVGYVGRLVPEKGLEDLFAALSICDPDVNFVIAGDGPMEKQLSQILLRNGTAHRVKFLGAVPAARLPVVMSAMDVLALPSRKTASWKEQFGRVIIEAQACGTPVIGARTGAIPDVVGEGGILVAERSPAEIASAIARLRGSPALVRQMGRAGEAQVRARYTWEQVAVGMHRIYVQMMDAGRRSRRKPIAVAKSELVPGAT